MRRIAIGVVVCYVLLLVVLTLPVLGVCFWKDFSSFLELLGLGKEVFSSVVYWGFIGVLALCHVVLLCIPLRIARERPVAKRHIWIPVAVTGFLLGCLVFGLYVAGLEALKLEDSNPHIIEFAFLIGGAVWLLWAVIFYLRTRQRDAKSIVQLQSQWLFKSSLLALLIAVPMHIVARSRDECCAGYETFVALAFGIPIMLMSLGPGVFFLYANRWKQLQPKPKGDAPNDTPMDN